MNVNNISTFPVLLRNPEILVIGGGKVALQKAKAMSENNISFKVIADNILPEIAKLTDNIERRKVSESVLGKFKFIIDATGNPEVAALVLKNREKYGYLVNRVDNPEDSDFYFPALLRKGKVKIAISTDGASPILSRLLRDKINKTLPEKLEDLADKLALERRLGIIDSVSIGKEAKQTIGKVFLIGCGPGDPELLTLKALRAFYQADIALYDHLISEEILELLPEETEKKFVGKPHSKATITQNDINQMMLNYAKEGLNVIRLKSGDPYIFGRGAEEAEFLAKRNIAVEVIPGMSSVIAGPAFAGIPLTVRNYSSNLSILTACKSGGEINTEIIKFVKQENHTTVVLMGLHKVRQIYSLLTEINVNENLPVAFICNATRRNQKIIKTSVKNMVESSKEAESPSLMVFGEIVNFFSNRSLKEEYLNISLCEETM